MFSTFSRLSIGLLTISLIFLFSALYVYKNNSFVFKTIHSEDRENVLHRDINIEDPIPYKNLFHRQLSGFLNWPKLKWLKFERLVKRKAPADDIELVDFVRSSFHTPSSKRKLKMSRKLLRTPQAEEIEKKLNGKKNGFFLEAGALDGERSSNSIYFEMKLGWTGLLVEMDPFFYTQLMGKNRNCLSLNACLSPYNYVTMLEYADSNGGLGRINMKSGTDIITTVPCFPVETLLRAANRTKEGLDFFSLDVEGMELPILETIDLKKIPIRSLAVEYAHGKDKSKLNDYMVQNGYDMVKDLDVTNEDLGLYVKDFIFVENKSMVKLRSGVQRV